MGQSLSEHERHETSRDSTRELNGNRKTKKRACKMGNLMKFLTIAKRE